MLIQIKGYNRNTLEIAKDVNHFKIRSNGICNQSRNNVLYNVL